MQVLYLLSYEGPLFLMSLPARAGASVRLRLERETGLEPATLSLEG